jgi:hypothetical protein
MLIPFYIIDKIMIDGYFIDKLSQKEDRILLVKNKKLGFSSGEIKPLPFNTVVSALEEGYLETLNSNSKELRIPEILESIFYNTGIYMKNREKEVIEKTLSKIYGELYSRLLKIIKGGNYEITWHNIELKDNQIFFDNSLDKIYTKLFLNDEKFKSEFLKLLPKIY